VLYHLTLGLKLPQPNEAFVVFHARPIGSRWTAAPSLDVKRIAECWDVPRSRNCHPKNIVNRFLFVENQTILW
jgi:hypothetical protein